MRVLGFLWIAISSLILISPAVVADSVISLDEGENIVSSPSTSSDSLEELLLFEELIEELASSRNDSLVRLAEKTRRILDAPPIKNLDSYIAARAVFDHHREGLDPIAQEDLRVTLESLKSSQEDVPRRSLEKVNVVSGCGAELACLDDSTASCFCTTPDGVCSHEVAANQWGGRVTCDCSGTVSISECSGGNCQIGVPTYIGGPDLCQGSIETYQTSSVPGATNYRWEVVSTPIVRNTSGPTMSLSGHYFFSLGAGLYILRVRAEAGQCIGAWRWANLVVRSNGDPLCTVCDNGDNICF